MPRVMNGPRGCTRFVGVPNLVDRKTRIAGHNTIGGAPPEAPEARSESQAGTGLAQGRAAPAIPPPLAQAPGSPKTRVQTMRASRFPLAFVASILAAGALCAQSGALADGEQPDAADSGSEQAASAEEALGRIDFPNSGAREAQADFLRGVLLLHNFEYEDAAEAFRSAQALDPDFVLAFWGEALTYSHPIWGEDDPDQARAVLERLAASREERARIPATERERALLASVEELYGEGERMERNRNYSKSLERARQRFPDDLEIASFHALSILGTSENGRDIPTYMRAAAVAEEVFMKNPEHPGALHYAIHAYDDPVHAHLGLRMARRYDKVAAAAAHALHMPSHIYVALGMWKESVAANIASAKAADDRRARKNLPIEARGYHALWWLAYSHQQLGQFKAARELVLEVAANNEESGSERTRAHLIRMRSAYVLDADAWDDELLAIEVETSDLGIVTATQDLFTRGFAAVKRGQLETARALHAELLERRTLVSASVLPLAGLASCCAPVSAGEFLELTPDMQAARIMAGLLEGSILLAEGDEAAGIARIREAAAEEVAMGFDFGPPDVIKPANELLGEVLLDADRPAEAQAAFETALKRAPGRFASTLGRIAAIENQGDTERGHRLWKEDQRTPR